MPTTSNFGWTTPADTDLVKDGASAIRTLGNGIDTSLVDLKGGTTGQNLRKNSNTDLDFVWAGDATNTVIDAAGDLLYGSAADTMTRLAIGTAGQVLTVNSGATAPEWKTASSGGLTLINTGGTTLSGSSTSVNTIPGTYKNLHIYIEDFYTGSNNNNGYLQLNGTTSDNYAFMGLRRSGGGAEATATEGNNDVGIYFASVCGSSAQGAFCYFLIPNYAATNHRKTAFGISYTKNDGSPGDYYVMEPNGVLQNSSAAITSIQIVSNGSWGGGKVYVYGEA